MLHHTTHVDVDDSSFFPNSDSKDKLNKILS